MGPQEDYVETVFTCEGDINDPDLQTRLEDFKQGLRDLLSTDKRKLILKKVEPWNSVRVTFKIPLEAARRLKQLAQQGNASLRQLGVLAVQLEGDQLISLTIAGRNNERTQLIFRTADDSTDAASVTVINPNSRGSGGGVSLDVNQQNPNEATQQNIAQYLRQGSAIFDSILQNRNNDASIGNVSHQESLPSSSPTQNNSQLGIPEDIVAAHSLDRMVGLPGISLGSANFPVIPGLINSQMGLRPPPPYPGSSSLLNNLAKVGRAGITSTASPLLVNLLQTDPNLAASYSSMLPPSETSPQQKKKRKPRKPKDKNKQAVSTSDGEKPIQSVPNPLHESYGNSLPLVTSGISSNMPSIPMVTQALPASSQPSVTYSSQGISPVLTGTAHVDSSRPGILKGQKVEDRVDQRLPENTAGKIINPYTGLLEPMDSSDSSPSKSDTSFDGYSPHKNISKRSPKDQMIHLSAFNSNNVVDSRLSTVPSSVSTDMEVSRQLASNNSSTQYSYSLASSPEHPISSILSHNANSAQSNVSRSHQHADSLHSEFMSDSNRIETTLTTSSVVSSSVHKSLYSVKMSDSVLGRTSVSQHTVNSNVSTESAQWGSQASMHSESVTSSHNIPHVKDCSLLSAKTEQLLNENHPNPAKNNLGSPIIQSPDSENSSQSSLLQDTPNDMGVVPPGSSLDSKVYNHDSGVGSSSERSDDTPSEPGDHDFKSGHPEENLRLAENLSKEIIPKLDLSGNSKTVNEIPLMNHKNGKPNSINSANLQNFVSKQNMNITVGCALSNSLDTKYCDSKSMAELMTADKMLGQNSLVNNIGKNVSHKNSTILHWSSAEKLHAFQVEGNTQVDNQHPFNEFMRKADNLHPKKKFEFEGRSVEVAVSSHHQKGDHGQRGHLSSYTSSNRTPSPRPPSTSNDLINNKDVKCNSEMYYSSLNSRLHGASASLEHQFLSHAKYSKSSHSEAKCKSPTSITSSVPMLSVMKKSAEIVPPLDKGLNSSQGNGERNSSYSKSENGCKFSNPSSVNGLVEVSKTIDVTSMYKRKSPVGATVNSIPHNFFDPALPSMAKRLTESVQKLVKPLLTTESSSLPHSQRKSPINTSKLLATSSPPRHCKGSGTKSPISDALLEKNNLNFSESVMFGQNVVVNDNSFSLTSASEHLSSQGIENSMLSSLSHNFELPQLHLDGSQSFESSLSAATVQNHVSDSGSKKDKKSPSETRSHFLGTLLKQTGVQRDSIEDTKHSIQKDLSTASSNQNDMSECKPNVVPVSSVHFPPSSSNSLSNMQEGVHESKTTNSVKSIQQIAPLKIKLTDKKIGESEKSYMSHSVLSNDSQDIKSESEKPLYCSSCKSKTCECSEKGVKYKVTKHNDLKSSSLKSPKSTEDTIKNALEVIEKSKMELEERKVEVTVVTKPKTVTEQKSDKSEPTVPPLILRVRRKSISESQDNLDDSSSKMTLRTSKGSSKSEESSSQHRHKALRTQLPCETVELGEKIQSTDNVEKDVGKSSPEEDSNKRSLRKRKTTPLEIEPEAKKSNNDTEDLKVTKSDTKDIVQDVSVKNLRSTDTKENSAFTTLKSDSNKVGDKLNPPENLENDITKLGLRNREKAKAGFSEEKGKNPNNRDVKDLKRVKSVEEEDRGKRQPSRRNKPSSNPQNEKSQKNSSPQLNEKTQINVVQENSHCNDVSNKRSTRSAKAKDATDTLPPSNKRRRTSKDGR